MKTPDKIKFAMRWVITTHHENWNRCNRKKSYPSKEAADLFLKSETFTRPVSTYHCPICGLYHIGTKFGKTYQNTIWIKNASYDYDRWFPSLEEARDYGHKLDRSNTRYKIKHYKHPARYKDRWFIYLRCSTSHPPQQLCDSPESC